MNSAELQVITGPDEGRSVELRDRPVTIGRSPDCPLVLSDSSVSRQHIKLFVADGKHFVADMNSSHGTRVNGEPVTRKELRDGDVIEIGRTRLEFRLRDTDVSEDSPVAFAGLVSDSDSDSEDPFAGDNPAAIPEIRLRSPPSIPGPRNDLSSSPGASALALPVRGAGKVSFFRQDLDQHAPWRRWASLLIAVLCALALGYVAMKIVVFLVTSETGAREVKREFTPPLRAPPSR